MLNGRNRDKLARAAEALAGEGIAAGVAPFDVTDAAAVADEHRRHRAPPGADRHSRQQRGDEPAQALEEFTPDEWRALMAANLDGPFLVTRALIAGDEGAAAAARSSTCARSPPTSGGPNIVPYAASKGALRMLTRALAVELAPSNIQVNGISPGFFKTEMNAPLIADAEFSAWVARRTPAGRWGEPPEIAGAAVFLASSAADYVTGHVLYVDGGFSAAY